MRRLVDLKLNELPEAMGESIKHNNRQPTELMGVAGFSEAEHSHKR